MIRILFFGEIAKVSSLRGRVTPSTTLRCIRISDELVKRGLSSNVRYCTIRDYQENIRAIRSSDLVVFHRIQFPLAKGPEPATELFLQLSTKANEKKTVFDIDDSIFLNYPILTELFMKRSDLVTAGSHQLYDFAKGWNRNVELLPTSVDTSSFTPELTKRNGSQSIVLGWHGTAYVQRQNLQL